MVIDSGVQRGHPLISPALADAEVFPDSDGQIITGGPDDGDEIGGHGTGVSGIAVYGDVSQCIHERLFQPNTWLFSARVTNENNEYNPDLLLENQLGEAIRYFIENYPNCKVINISLGDANLPFREGQKQFVLAAKIDEIAYEFQHKNLVFVISAGNSYYETDSGKLFRRDYPNYLLYDEARIIEPATAALAITVGSLSLGTGSAQYPEDPQRTAIARQSCYPSPFTRTGFGVDGMLKPELVDFGGDLVMDGKRIIPNEFGVAILTLAKDYNRSLFRAYCGTSFAPRVANIAAQLFTQFPNATSNLIRALIASSASLPAELPPALQGDTPEQINNRLRVYGYGKPDLLRAKFSAENHVVLLVDNAQIPVGYFQIFEIPPLPRDFFEIQGTRTLSVTLAFDPPTRPTRGDSYLGVTIESHLFKNINPENITRAFASASQQKQTEDFTELSLQELKRQYGSGVEVKLSPGGNLRRKGTLQRGQVEITARARGYDQSPLYLVVSCNRKWVKPGEYDMQRYALVVSLSHTSTEVDLYNQLRVRTRIADRIRVR